MSADLTADVRIINVRFLLGCGDGLAERTAAVEIALPSGVAVDDITQSRFRAIALGLAPEEPLHGVGAEDWPTAFVAGPIADGPVERLGCWIVALTIAIQRWARDPAWHGRIVRAETDRLLLAIPWRRQAVFTEALNLALRLITASLGAQTLLDRHTDAVPAELRRWFGDSFEPSGIAGQSRPTLSRHFNGRWADIQAGGLSPYTLRFIEAGIARGMPFDVLPNCVQLGWGANAERLDMTFTRATGWLPTLLAKDKLKTNATLARQGLPVPQAVTVADMGQAERAAAAFGWPVVIKPANRDQGVGVVAGITNLETLRSAFTAAERLSPARVIMERHIDGDDHRLLVVRGRTLTTVRRIPAGVTGDGRRTIAELAAQVNADPRRGTGAFSLLKKLVLDDMALGCLSEQGLGPDSVPQHGRWVWTRRIANVSTGGTAVDVTAQVHPDNCALAERAARIVGLDIAGVDLLISDITRSWREVGGAVCEVNAQPGLRVHWLADPCRDLAGELLDILFADRPSRIPTAAICATAAAGATAELLYRIWTDNGRLTGLSTTVGTRVGTDIVSGGDLAGLRGTRAVLIDPAVEAAVFELPADRLAGSGSPCDYYDVVAVLDGASPASAVRDLANRARIALVLNADDEGCLQMRSHSSAQRLVLCTRNPHHPAADAHRRAGGDVVVADGGWVTVAKGERKVRLARWTGHCAALFAAATAWAQGIEAGVIAAAVGSESE